MERLPSEETPLPTDRCEHLRNCADTCKNGGILVLFGPIWASIG